MALQPNDPLFSKTEIKCNPQTLQFEVVGVSREHWANATPIRELFKTAFARVNLLYYNPHSFRKMLAVWALEHCSQMEFKAISQNIGHDHALTTYNAYGNLNDHKRRSVIQSIGTKTTELAHIPADQLMAEMARRMQG